MTVAKSEQLTEVLPEPSFQITLDLPQAQMQKLLDFCRAQGRPLNDVGTAAIADYISRSAPELEKVLSLD